MKFTRTTGLVACVVAALVLNSAGALAGTQGNPEILDPAADATMGGASAPDRLDIRAVWFEDVSADDVEVHIRVADLTSYADSGSFSDGSSIQKWEVHFDEGGQAYAAIVIEDSAGRTHAFVDVKGASEDNYPISDSEKRAPLEYEDVGIAFDASNDEIVLTLPRVWDYTKPPSPATTSVDWSDGTTFSSVRAFALQGDGEVSETPVGDGFTCASCMYVDSTTSGSNFVFGAALLGNPRLTVRPANGVVGVAAEGSAVDFIVRSTFNYELTATLQATVSATGWTVAPSQIPVSAPASGTKIVSMTVTPPSDARDGTAAVLTLTGGDFPVQALLVVGEDAAAAVASATATNQGAGDLTRQIQYFLRGQNDAAPASEDTAGGESSLAEYPGSLVSKTPAADTIAATMTRSLDAAGGAVPLGVWRTEPLTAPVALEGPVELGVQVDWSGVQGLRLVGLVGSQPPGEAWDGKDVPVGTVLLSSSPVGADAGSEKLVATGTADGLVLAPGDRLSVGVFLVHDGASDGASVTGSFYDGASPSQLTISISEQVAGLSNVAFPTSSTAVFRTGLGVSGQVGGFQETLSVVAKPVGGKGVALPVALAPRDVVVGSTGQAGSTSFEGSFGPGESGASNSHSFIVDENAVKVNLKLSSDDGQPLWVEVYTLNGTQRDAFVKASRGSQAEQRLSISYYELEAFGRGPYEAVVSVPQSTTGADYSLQITQAATARLADGRVDAYMVWDYANAAPGEYSVEIRSTADGKVVDSVSASYVLTELGPTLAPVASFIYDPPFPAAGQPIKFTDTSSDADGRIAGWKWNFGDGSTSNEPNPFHSYDDPGVYSVFLTVTDNLGVTDLSLTSPIEIVDPQSADQVPDATDAPNVGLPGGLEGLPLGGTARYYQGHYLEGLPHFEEYSDSWRDAEVAGLVGDGTDYLSSSDGEPRYIFGAVPESAPHASWGTAGLGFDNSLGASVSLIDGAVEQALEEASVRASVPTVIVGGNAIDADALGDDPDRHDDFSDGLLTATTSVTDGGADAERSIYVLAGGAHSDVRTTATGGPGQSVSIIADSVLTAGAGAWAAYGQGDQVRVVPADQVDGTQIDPTDGNLWVALFDPAGREVAGVVLAGDVSGATLSSGPQGVVVQGVYEGTGQATAAQYLLTYAVGSADATRYAGVQEIADMDANEIGLVVLEQGKAAGVGWAGSGADFDSAAAASGFVDDLFGNGGDEWSLTITAASENGGKTVRIVMPADYEERGLVLTLDGKPVSASAVTDGQNLILEVPIDHFSTRTLNVRALAPGVADWWQWLTIGFAMVMGGEAVFMGRVVLKSRAARRAAGLEMPRSSAVRKALGYEEGTPSDRVPTKLPRTGALLEESAQQQYKSALIRRLARETSPAPQRPGPDRARYGRCRECTGPVRFPPGQVAVSCNKCGTENLRKEVLT